MLETVFQAEKRITEYKVLTSRKLDDMLPELCAFVASRGVLIITDDHVAPLYLSRLTEMIKKSCMEVHCFILPAGEGNKSFESLRMILERLISLRFHRNDVIINLGGGVVSDIGGFAASMYMRGMQYINIPTTLLGMIDSSVGGKTAVDLLGVKNVVGAFAQPSLVIDALEFLSTLDASEIRSGLGELIKYIMISGKDLLRGYRKTAEFDEECINECCRIKLEYVKSDTFDEGKRRILNLGHTLGHAFEAASSFKLSHGEAVVLGLLAETELGEELCIVDKGTSNEVKRLVTETDLNYDYSMYLKNAEQYLLLDKKAQDISIAMPFVKAIGQPIIETMPIESVCDFLSRS